MKRLTLSVFALLVSQQIVMAQFVPITDLPSVPDSIPATGSESGFGAADNNYVTGFEPPPEGGSETVANFLKKLEPSVDTRLPESSDQATTRINSLLTAGKFDSALIEIAKLKKPQGNITQPTVNVQLLFLEARAYAGKGDIQKAMSIYRDMTSKYPELAEPWNNMAAIQINIGSLEEALESLKMAIAIRPNYPIANQNIGLIYTALAKQSFETAARQGIKGASIRAQQAQKIITGGN
ncbi:hypothetical protein V757_09360 [Pelistega indica]|uniref:Uncharacterized protein n=1 Tax=Pelistega indica TaxID=1414851 RepID=V8FY49_9BURK|nr:MULTISPECIES: tetratricopeptide repeat protein [Pelistega]ETD69199.1 hypothetical protein V757_09360 [Pelistega indica]